MLTKTISRFLVFFVTFCSVFALQAAPALASRFAQRGKESVVVKEREVIQDNYYASADNVKIQGYILGDLFVAGNNIEISGTVNGDVYAAGNTISITGNVDGTVYTAGQLVEIKGNIGRSAFVASSNAWISSEIVEDLMVFSADSKLGGSIGDDLRVFSNSANIDTTVGGDVISGAGSSSIDKSKVSGKIYDVSDDKDTKKAGLMGLLAARGDIQPTQQVVSYVLGLAGLFLLLAVTYKFMPIKVLRAMHIANTGHLNLLKAFGEGLLMTFLIPMGLIFLGIFGLIFPNILLPIYGQILIFGLLLYLLLGILGKVVITFALGDKIQRKFFSNAKVSWVSKAWSGVLFWAVLNILLMIPVVNVFAFIFEWVILTTGVGLVVMDKSLVWNRAWGGKQFVNIEPMNKAENSAKQVTKKKTIKKKTK